MMLNLMQVFAAKPPPILDFLLPHQLKEPAFLFHGFFSEKSIDRSEGKYVF